MTSRRHFLAQGAATAVTLAIPRMASTKTLGFTEINARLEDGKTEGENSKGEEYVKSVAFNPYTDFEKVYGLFLDLTCAAGFVFVVLMQGQCLKCHRKTHVLPSLSLFILYTQRQQFGNSDQKISALIDNIIILLTKQNLSAMTKLFCSFFRFSILLTFSCLYHFVNK